MDVDRSRRMMHKLFKFIHFGFVVAPWFGLEALAIVAGTIAIVATVWHASPWLGASLAIALVTLFCTIWKVEPWVRKRG